MKGWLFCKNIDCTFLSEIEGHIVQYQDYMLYTNLNAKFPRDIINDGNGTLLEGYISNKQELKEEYKYKDWNHLYRSLLVEPDFPNKLRGSFCGFKEENGIITFFTDHVGSKALFYYSRNDVFIISTRLLWMVQVLKANDIIYRFDELAAQYMLTYGYMIDNRTFISEIKRVLPGQKIIIEKNSMEIIQYYLPSIKKSEKISEQEAIKEIDKAFRKAVKREFEKDKEYGYEYLVDLSGGLDSRMVTWVAHDMGYLKQTNISYCKADYLDYRISSKIAKKLKHEFYFKQLDDFRWIYDFEDILKLNNGMALYSGITGGKDCLSNLNNKKYGIEHTGMIGDVIISCFAKNAKEAYKKPTFGKNQHSTKLSYLFSENILKRYENQEIFDLYARGFLGAMSSYPIRQEYFEVSSPFLDVDFMNTCFKLPIEYRNKHKIYLKWIETCYKEASQYGWEKWIGIKPNKNLYPLVLAGFIFREIGWKIRKFLKQEINNNMNPIDYWYANDKMVQDYFKQYYKDNINSECFSDSLRKDIKILFEEGTASEKTQVLTILGIAKLYFT